MVVPGDDLPLELLAGHLVDIGEPVGFGLVRAEQPEVRRVVPDHVAQEIAEHPGGLRHPRTRRGDRHGVVPEAGQRKVAQQHAPVGVRVRAHPPQPVRGQRGDLRHRDAAGVEQLLRVVRPHPRLELREVLRVGADLGQRHLVRPPRPLHRQPVHYLRPGPPLGRLQHDDRPGRPAPVAILPRAPLNRVDLADHRVHGGGQLLVHHLGVIACHCVDRVSVPGQQRLQLGVRDPGQHRRVGDLVPVQVQDRQHGPVPGRVEELAGVPAAGQRPGLGLPVADHAGHDQVRVVERRPVRVHQRVAQLAALVDRPGRLRRHMRGDAAGEGELPEQPGHARRVLRDGRIDLAVGALQPGTGHHRGPAVPRPGDVDHVQVVVPDHPVQVRVEHVLPRRGAPVPQQPRLDVVGPQRLGQQRVGHQVDLTHRQVVRRPPPGVNRDQLAWTQRCLLHLDHETPLSRTGRGARPQPGPRSFPSLTSGIVSGTLPTACTRCHSAIRRHRDEGPALAAVRTRRWRAVPARHRGHRDLGSAG